MENLSGETGVRYNFNNIEVADREEVKKYCELTKSFRETVKLFSPLFKLGLQIRHTLFNKSYLELEQIKKELNLLRASHIRGEIAEFKYLVATTLKKIDRAVTRFKYQEENKLNLLKEMR